jgi:hypothetical protein
LLHNLGALCWSLPAFAGGFIPYFYVFYLTLLLVQWRSGFLKPGSPNISIT